MIGPEDERPKNGSGVLEDAVTVELADVVRGVCALGRLTRTSDERETSMALACLGAETVAAAADGVALETAEPLERWLWRFEHGGVALDAELEAISPPTDFDEPATAELARATGLHRYEQLCRVRGELRVQGRRIELDGIGRRVHTWGEPSDARVRSLYAVAGDRAVTVTAVRPAGVAEHGGELIAAHLVRPESEPELFEDVRLSTVYDGTGRPRTAGLELYLAGDEYPRRVSGEAVCQAGSRAEAVQAAAFRWSLEGEAAQGGYRMEMPA
jgi:hypothetical protein